MDIQLLRETRIPLHLVHKASHALPRTILAAVDLSRPEDQIEGFNDQIIFDSNLAHTLHEAQSDAFQALAERNGIAAEHRHMRIGDPAKARDALGWKPKVGFEELVQMMVEHDLREQTTLRAP